jgi:hypothetical protein
VKKLIYRYSKHTFPEILYIFDMYTDTMYIKISLSILGMILGIAAAAAITAKPTTLTTLQVYADNTQCFESTSDANPLVTSRQCDTTGQDPHVTQQICFDASPSPPSCITTQDTDTTNRAAAQHREIYNKECHNPNSSTNTEGTCTTVR